MDAGELEEVVDHPHIRSTSAGSAGGSAPGPRPCRRRGPRSSRAGRPAGSAGRGRPRRPARAGTARSGAPLPGSAQTLAVRAQLVGDHAELAGPRRPGERLPAARAGARWHAACGPSPTATWASRERDPQRHQTGDTGQTDTTPGRGRRGTSLCAVPTTRRGTRRRRPRPPAQRPADRVRAGAASCSRAQPPPTPRRQAGGDEDDLDLVPLTASAPSGSRRPNGHQAAGAGVGLDLLPQPADVHGHRRLVAERPAPHLAAAAVGVKHLPGWRRGSCSRSNSRVVSASSAPSGSTGARGSTTRSPSATRTPRLGLRLPDPTQHRSHPQRELAGAERLGDVVVGAEPRARPPGPSPSPGRQHDDRHVSGLPSRRHTSSPPTPGSMRSSTTRSARSGSWRSARPPHRRPRYVVPAGAQVRDDDLPDRAVVIHHQHVTRSLLLVSGRQGASSRPPRIGRRGPRHPATYSR